MEGSGPTRTAPPPPRAPGPEAAPPGAGARYAPGRELGRGGAGKVTLVYDRWLGRDVARKELLSLGGPEAEERFIREARAAARLAHPNIVPIYEIARDEEGRLYYTMKRVEGRNLAEALAAARTAEARLALIEPFVRVVEAMAHAHGQGVLHRDLKPQNVMLGDFGETFVVDWGLAGQGDGVAPQTIGGAGTPAYMSPEQREGRPLGPPTDVWALGVMLYELVHGVLPFGPYGTGEPGGRAPAWTPATTLSGPSPRQRPPVRSETVSPELDAIARRAMAWDARDRHPDAAALLAELRAWQAGRWVQSYAYSTREIVGRILRRHRARIVGGLVLGLLLLAGAAWVAARELRAREAVATSEAAASAARAERLYQEALAAWEARDPGLAWLRAAASLELHESAEARGVLLLAANHAAPRLERHLPGGGGPCRAMAWGPGGALAYTGESLHVVEAGGGPDVGPRTFEAPRGGFAWAGPDAVWFAGAPEGEVGLLSLSTGQVAWVPGAPGGARSLRAYPGGGLLYGHRALPGLALVRPDLRVERLATPLAGDVLSVVVGPPGVPGSEAPWVAGVDAAGQVAVVPPSGEAFVLPTRRATYALAFGPEARWLALGDDRHGGAPDARGIEVWDLARRAPRALLEGHGQSVTVLARSADERWLVSGGTDGQVRLWDAATLRAVHRLGVGGEEVWAVEVSADGQRLAALTGGCSVLVWTLPGSLGRPRAAGAVHLAAEGSTVAAADEALLLRPGRPAVRMPLPPSSTRAAAAGRVATADSAGRVTLHDVERGGRVAAWALGEHVFDLDLSPDGRDVVLVTPSRVLRLSVGADGHPAPPEPLAPAWAPPARYAHVRWSREGDRAVVDADGLTLVVHKEAAGWTATPLGPPELYPAAGVALAPGAARAAWTKNRPGVFVLEGGEVRTLPTKNAVMDAVFVQGGDRVAAIGNAGALEIVDVRSGAPVAVTPAVSAFSVNLSTDLAGQRLSTGNVGEEFGVLDLGPLDWSAAEAKARAVAAVGERPW